MRRATLGLYALILVQTVVWVALVPLAPTYARNLRHFMDKWPDASAWLERWNHDLSLMYA